MQANKINTSLSIRGISSAGDSIILEQTITIVNGRRVACSSGNEESRRLKETYFPADPKQKVLTYLTVGQTGPFILNESDYYDAKLSSAKTNTQHQYQYSTAKQLGDQQDFDIISVDSLDLGRGWSTVSVTTTV